MNYFSALYRYYKEVKAESDRIAWCDRRYVLGSTLMICIVVLIASVCCLLVDYGANTIVSSLLKIKLF